MTDKGYDAKVNRQAARERGICPVIPYRSNTKDKPAFFPKALYKTRARIEQTIGKLKRFKRIAPRCEKTAQNYAALVAFACGIILVKSVHTTITIRRRWMAGGSIETTVELWASSLRNLKVRIRPRFR